MLAGTRATGLLRGGRGATLTAAGWAAVVDAGLLGRAAGAGVAAGGNVATVTEGTGRWAFIWLKAARSASPEGCAGGGRSRSGSGQCLMALLEVTIL